MLPRKCFFVAALVIASVGLLAACGSVPADTGSRTAETESQTSAPLSTATFTPRPTATVPPTPTPSPTPDMAAEPVVAFERTYGGDRMDRGVFVTQTADGGYALTGVTASEGAGNEDILLIRIDPDGNELWSQTYGGSDADNGWSVCEMADGGFMVAGFTRSFGAGGYDVYLVRTDSMGEALWIRTFGGAADDYGWAMRPLADGGAIIAGQTESFGAGDIDVYLIRVGPDGDELWSQTYGGEGRDRGFSLQLTADGGFVIAGITYSYGEGGRNAYVIKTDAEGELQWQRAFGENGDDVAHSIDVTTDGGILVIGYSNSFQAAVYDAYLIKLDAAGETEWTRMFGGPADDRIITGQQTADGGIILVGYTKSYGAGNWDVYLVKTDEQGAALWEKTFGQRGEDTGYTVQETAEGGYILTGDTQPGGASSRDVYLIRLAQP